MIDNLKDKHVDIAEELKAAQMTFNKYRERVLEYEKEEFFYEESSFNYKGYLCKVLFMPLGHRCGYVKLPKYHPLCGKSYDKCNDFINCHGGLTYSEYYLAGEECKDGGYWIGFDCAHFGDGTDIESFKRYFPKEDAPTVNPGTVRNLEFCKEECKSIADQLKSLYEEKGSK